LAWRRNLFAITAASFIGATGFTLVMPFLPLYFHELGVEDVGEVALWSGLSLGATPALAALLSPFWGRLADRFGRKIMVERALVSFVVVMAAMAFVTEPWHVLALRGIQGVFAGYGALTLTMVADSAPPDRMAFGIGVVQTSHRLGPAVGPIIGGVVTQFVGLRSAFLVTSGFYVVAIALVVFLYHEPPHHAAAHERARRVTFRSVLAFENFILLMGVVFGLTFVDRSFGPILPLYIAQLGTEIDRVPLVAGFVFSIAAGAAAAGNQACSVLLRRYTPRVVIASGAAAGAAAALLYALSRSSVSLLAVTPLFGFAMGIATTSAYTAAGTLFPPTARSVGFGLLSTASMTALAVSPIFNGFLGATSIRAVFLLDAVALVVLGLSVLRLMLAAPVEKSATPVAEEL
jgi:DHA1 family multidrug resistance protein-like MFS transporter